LLLKTSWQFAVGSYQLKTKNSLKSAGDFFKITANCQLPTANCQLPTAFL